MFGYLRFRPVGRTLRGAQGPLLLRWRAHDAKLPLVAVNAVVLFELRHVPLGGVLCVQLNDQVLQLFFLRDELVRLIHLDLKLVHPNLYN